MQKETNTRVEIGDKINKVRASRGLTLYAVAKTAGIKIDQLKAVEDGSKAYTFDTLIKVCDALDLSIVIAEKK